MESENQDEYLLEETMINQLYNEYFEEIASYNEQEIMLLIEKIMTFMQLIEKNEDYLLNVSIKLFSLYYKEAEISESGYLDYSIENVLNYINQYCYDIITHQLFILTIPMFFTNDFFSYLQSISMIMAINLFSFLSVASYLISDFRKEKLNKKRDKIMKKIIEAEKNVEKLSQYEEYYSKFLNISIQKLSEILFNNENLRDLYMDDELVYEIDYILNNKGKVRKRKR